jgi:hypothetical protein
MLKKQPIEIKSSTHLMEQSLSDRKCKAPLCTHSDRMDARHFAMTINLRNCNDSAAVDSMAELLEKENLPVHEHYFSVLTTDVRYGANDVTLIRPVSDIPRELLHKMVDKMMDEQAELVFFVQPKYAYSADYVDDI